MEIALYFIAAYSISNIVVNSSLFESFRDWLCNRFGEDSKMHELFECMMCFPTWVGFFLSTMFILLGYGQFSPFYSNGLDIIWLAVFMDGMLSSGITWIVHTLQEFFEDDE